MCNGVRQAGVTNALTHRRIHFHPNAAWDAMVIDNHHGSTSIGLDAIGYTSAQAKTLMIHKTVTILSLIGLLLSLGLRCRSQWVMDSLMIPLSSGDRYFGLSSGIGVISIGGYVDSHLSLDGTQLLSNNARQYQQQLRDANQFFAEVAREHGRPKPGKMQPNKSFRWRTGTSVIKGRTIGARLFRFHIGYLHSCFRFPSGSLFGSSSDGDDGDEEKRPEHFEPYLSKHPDDEARRTAAVVWYQRRDRNAEKLKHHTLQLAGYHPGNTTIYFENVSAFYIDPPYRHGTKKDYKAQGALR